MLSTLISLGSDLNLDPVKVLVDKSNAKDIFVIDLDRNCNYLDLKVNENEGEEKYLYKFAKEQVNRGKFITGLIKADKLKELKKILIQTDKNEKDSYFQDFKNRQITWILKQNILKNSKVLSMLPKDSKEILVKLKKEVQLNQDSIMDDFCKKILEGNYERNILLTYRIGGKYLSEINGFNDFFQIAVLGEENFKTEFSGRCMTCSNNKAFLGKLNEPLPFFTIDKYNFIPDGNKKNAHRVFQICKKCVINLISGFKYVSNNMNFIIPNSFGKIKLRFWLIPQLNDSSLIKDFLNKPDKNLSSFKDLFNISKEMELVSELDTALDLSNIKYLKNYYNYIALFYTYNNGPRLIESIDGIYPPRFLELSKVKFYVDNIAKRNGNKFRFFFGLLVDFLEEYEYKKNANKEKSENERWMKLMAHIMNCIFTQKRIDNSLIIKILIEKIKLILFTNDIDSFHEIVLKAILILDYLYMINTLMPAGNYNKNNSLSFSNNKKIDFVINFLNDHSTLLSNNNLRAICAIGIITGIIIKAQRRYFNSEKTPFLSRLNRLEMDIKRLGDLPRYDWIKLYHYKAKEFEDIFTYLTNNEISNLDYNDKIQKELMNLIFVIGIAHGFTIFTLFENKNWKIEN